MPYKLSATLAAHTSDVRALSSPTNDLVLSASRDTTAISWKRASPTSPFEPTSVLHAGSRYINSIAYIPPTPDAPQGYVVTGGQEAVVNVFSLAVSNDEPDFVLLGHSENVCTLDVSPGGTIISGSWDQTAKVWKNFTLAYDLKGHQAAVWAVLAIDEEQSLTGSADKTIRLWQQHKLIQTFRGHTDAVRGLTLLPDIGFASCSNDSEIRVWTLGGDAIYTLSGHTSFVYTLSVLPNGDIVSGGEDRSVRVWKDGECAQIIVHPAISVWAVSTMPNGDIVSGCSDGIVRVFSASEERWAPTEQLKDYDAHLASQAIPSQLVGDVKKSDLPGIEALATPGKKEGDVKMIKNGENVEAHQWDSAAQAWQKMGDVVDAVGQGRKQLFDGKEYDYVFDVDIQDGVPPLKLPYNVTDNPYGAAQRFLERNELPASYVDEVVKFIETNTAGVNIGSTGNNFVDPYTGASRYQSSANSVPTAPAASAYMDPYTGASRYSGAPSPSPAAPSSAYNDPYTGASRYSGTPTPAPAPTVPTSKLILPVRQFVHFKQSNVTAMHTKIVQLDEALKHEISTISMSLYPEEISALDDIFNTIKKLTTAYSGPTPPPLTSHHLTHIVTILERWPVEHRFPVIDLSRLLVGYCPQVLSTPEIRLQFYTALFTACDWSEPWTSPIAKTRGTNNLLLLRTLANAFQDGTRIDDGPWTRQLLESLAQAPYTLFTKMQRVALTTILLNFSCLTLTAPVEPSLSDQHRAMILQVLELETEDSEAVYRAVVALGNTFHAAKHNGSSLDSVYLDRVRQCTGKLSKTFSGDERVLSVVQEISTLL